MFEKMLSNRLQFEAAKHGILHPNQFGGVCQNSTKDAGCFLTPGWHAKLKTSVVAFDLAQFSPPSTMMYSFPSCTSRGLCQKWWYSSNLI
jgi:hypothetical protein